MNRKVRWIHQFCNEFRLSHYSGFWVESADVDALAVATSGRKALLHIGKASIGAEIYEVLTVGRTPRVGKRSNCQNSAQGKIADHSHELALNGNLSRVAKPSSGAAG